MISNNIHKICILSMICCGLATVFTSCRFEEDDYFDESASLRVEHTNQQVKSILTSPENGWVMQYFCGKGVAHFEGFNIFAKFTEGNKVTLASNHRMLRDERAGQLTEASSLYDLLLEDGPVLAMNTWNDVLTPFVDPVNPWYAPKYTIKDGAGMQGDNNFVILSYNDDEVILRGERYDGMTRLIKCDRSWEQYLADAEAMRDRVSSTEITNYYVITETDTMFFLTNGNKSKEIEAGLRSGRIQFSDDLTNPIKFDSLSCVFTPNGLRFERPDTIGAHTFQEFTLNEDQTALVNEDGTVKVFATWDYYLAQSEAIQWIDAESLSDDLKALYDALDAALKANNRNYSLARIGIGRTTNANNVLGLCIQWYTNTRKTSRNMGGLALKRSIPQAAQITITCAEDANIDNNLKARSADVQAAARALGAAMSKTYNVTPGSYFVPSTAQFVSTDGVTSFTYAE